MSELFNNTALKRHLLERIKVVNPALAARFNRVSEKAITDLDARFRKVCDDYLRGQRKGHTITTP